MIKWKASLINDSCRVINGSAPSDRNDFQMQPAYLLVNVQFPEDLCCVEKMLILEDPAIVISAFRKAFATISVSLTSWHCKPVMEG